MLKDLTTNQLRRMIFVLEHFAQLLISKITELEDFIFIGNDNISDTKKSQLQDLELFYTEQMNHNSDILERFCQELEFRELSAFD